MTNDLVVTIFKPIIPYALVLISIEIINMLMFIPNSFIIKNKDRDLIIWKLVIIVCLNC